MISVSSENIRLKKIRKVVAQIECNNNSNRGSGVIVSLAGKNYVLTAKHCVYDKQTNSLYSSINVFIATPSKKTSLQVANVICSENKDCAVIELGHIDEYSPSVKVVLYSGFLHITHTLVAYFSTELKYYSFIPSSESTFQYDQEVGNIKDTGYFKGMSGGGFFVADDNCEHLYMPAILLREGYNSCDNNEFDVLPVEAFKELLPDIEIINEGELYPGTQTVAPKVRNTLRPIKEALLHFEENEREKYINAKRLEEIIKHIMDNQKDVLYISALSGLGKTRLLFEAFSKFNDLSNIYYTDYFVGKENISIDAEQIMSAHKAEDGVIVVDNCPTDLLEYLISVKKRINSDFRIVATTHDVFKNNHSENLWILEELHPQEIKKEVDAYIENRIGSSGEVRDIVEKIKKISDGYPMMAIQLVNAYLNGDNPNVDIVKDLMPKIMQYDEDKRTEQEAMMRMVSLFQPMPYTGAQEDVAKCILKSDIFSHLYGKSDVERNDILHSVVEKYKGRLIECQGEWLNIRPFPLAVYLTKEWFDNCAPSNFRTLLKELQELPERIRNVIIEDFSKHIEYMQGNESAIGLINNILLINQNKDFFNEEVILSTSGSRLLLAMSPVSPNAVAQCLYDTFFYKEDNWIKENVVGRTRRNIVWALEKLVFVSESFDRAFDVMACLAVNENENLGNNATEQFRQLFHIMLPGTEVDLERRINAVKRIAKRGEEYALLVVSAFPMAMHSHSFTRTGGGEKFGLLRKQDYMPKTYKEINDYRRHYVELINDIEEKYPKSFDAIEKVISDNITQWVGSHICEIIAPLLNKIQKKLGTAWPALYENLSNMMRYSPEGLTSVEIDTVKQWMQASRPVSFLVDIKDASHDFWKKDMSERNPDTVRDFFSPLANKFVNDNIYRSKEEISLLIDDNEPDYRDFCNNVFALFNTTQKEVFVETVVNALNEKENVSNSYFVLAVARNLRGSSLFNILVENIFEQKKFELYISIYVFEDTDFAGYNHLKQVFSNVSDYDFLDTYLEKTRRCNWDYRYKMLSQVVEDFPDATSHIINYLETIQYYLREIKDARIWNLIKSILLNFNLSPDDEEISQYQNLILRVLKLNHDRDFAKAIFEKFVAIYSTRCIYGIRESVIAHILENYTDDVWDILWDALLDEKRFLFFFNVKNELGSGSGFGAGPLFQIENAMSKMQDICRKHPKSAPVRIAEMAPCYRYVNDKVVSFSDYFVWLAEEYGDTEDVLDSISANLGSYSWVGSLIPYYKRNIKCFELLLSSEKLSVDTRKWIEDCIKSEESRLKNEENRESYERMHYE